LVVEDNADFRLLLELTLRDEGYAVDTLSSAEEAVHLLRTREYGLVLSDYSLPVHSGAWLRSQTSARGPNIPFFIITGDPDAPGIPEDAVVIPKPVDFEWLLREVRRTLTHRSIDRSIGVRMRPGALPHQSASPAANSQTPS